MVEEVAREIKTAPEKLVAGGKFTFGTFNSQFREVNLLDANKPLNFWLPRPLLAMRLKEWQAFQLGNDRWFMLVVLYNAKFSALAQFIMYDKQAKKKYIFDKMVPSWKIKVPGSLWDAQQSYRDHDNSLQIVSKLGQGRFFIHASITDQKGLPDIKADFELFHDEGQVAPIVVSIPLGNNRGMYSHKCLMPMQGSVKLGVETIEFKRQESFAIIDDHKAFYPYRLRYDWVTAAGYAGGKLIGFNLTDNQSIDADKYNENCLWYDGKLQLLPAVKFSRPQGVEGEWQVRDKFGRVELTFKPESMGKIEMDMLLIKVRYYGPFGYAGGFIKDESGSKINFDGYFGMGEQKYIRG